MQCNGEFKKVCQLCYEDIIMKSWVVVMNQTMEKLRSLNLLLTKKHEVTRKKRLILLVEFLELSLERYFVKIGGYLFKDVCCAFVARS